MRKLIFLSILAMLFLGGCAVKKDITSSTPSMITIKNKQLALSDTGFINRGKAYANVQVFSAGTVLFNLEMVGNYVCMEGKCVDKLTFNQHFFQAEHYEGLLEDILNRAPIYGGEKLRKVDGGFEQEFEFKESHIFYKVDAKTLLFKDTKQNVLIRLKELE